jgi:hypothetical protein
MTGLPEKLSQRLGRFLPSRIPLLYLVLSVLLALSVIPLLIYGTQVSSRNREALQTNEQELQTAVTRGIAQEIRLYVRSMDLETRSLVRSLRTTGAIQNVAEERHADSLREATEEFVREAENILFLTIVNEEQRGIAGGDPTVGQDDFVKGELGEGFQKAQLGTAYNSKAFLAQQARSTVPVMVMARPLSVGNDFRGMVATVVSLEFLRLRLEEASKGGLVTYVVDGQGRLVVHPDIKNFNVGRDMSQVRSVQMFREGVRGTTTQPFELDGQQMLGTQSPVPELDWAVIAWLSRCAFTHHATAGAGGNHPRHRQGRLLPSSQSPQPHRNWRTRHHLQHHDRRPGEVRRTVETGGAGEPRTLPWLHPHSFRRHRRKGPLHAGPFRARLQVLGHPGRGHGP